LSGPEKSLIEDVRTSFKSKGLEFVSLSESTADPQKSVLTYKSATGETATRDIAIPLSELEDTVAAIETIDPTDLANYLLKEQSDNKAKSSE
jgi:hypothetical protein